MKLSKIIAILLVLSLFVLILPACGDDTDDNDTETTVATDETTVATDETTEAAETTEAPETTEAVTEPPKVYEYTTVFEVNFADMEDGEAPFTANGMDNLRIEGGLLKATSNGGDPHMPYTGEDAVFPAESVQIIEIKLMNYTVDYNMQFFFTTETIGWAEEASYKEYYDWSADDGDDNDWNIVQIDTSWSDEWIGNITGFRLDPASAEGDFEIEYIKFIAMTEVPA